MTTTVAEQVNAREYTYVQCFYRGVPLGEMQRTFLVLTPDRKEARRIAADYAERTWGIPHSIDIYPRNYIKEARQLAARGRIAS